MPDWHEVMNAQHEADGALDDVARYGAQLEDNERTDNGLGLLLAARAVCLELRAHAIYLGRIADKNG